MSAKPDPLDGYIRIGSVASYLDMHRDSVVKLAGQLHIPIFMIGGSRKFRRTHFELLKVYAAQQRAKGS